MSALLLLLLLGAWSSRAQQPAVKNPHTTKEDIAAGGRVFRAHWAVCHGPGGSGGHAADLTRDQYQHGNSDPELFLIISEGIPGTEMPATFFQGTQLWQLVAYVQSLRQGPETAPEGNPAAGKALFEGKGGCLQCHVLEGQGGRSAPELTNIGTKRSAEYLRASLVRPNEKVLPQHYLVQATTRNGERISGVRLNEDSYSVQMLDSKGSLISLLKDELQEYKVEKTSPMPSYEKTLSNQELDDLIAYLASLRRKR
jgi:putative heme-binding domain-containing protein